jgi:hypothetical protein
VSFVEALVALVSTSTLPADGGTVVAGLLVASRAVNRIFNHTLLVADKTVCLDANNTGVENVFGRSNLVARVAVMIPCRFFPCRFFFILLVTGGRFNSGCIPNLLTRRRSLFGSDNWHLGANKTILRGGHHRNKKFSFLAAR